jgi:hypothetical protein
VRRTQQTQPGVDLDRSEASLGSLERPLGVASIPNSGENAGAGAKSWQERKRDMLDYSKNLEERRKLCVFVSYHSPII